MEQSCNKKPYQDAVNHKLKMMKNLDEKISNIRIKDLAFAIWNEYKTYYSYVAKKEESKDITAK